MSNILDEVQHYVADKLNADPQLSACHFIAENRRDVEFEIKQALGKQGVVGLVMTPKATFAGAYMDTSLAWQLDELEIDIVENVTVNRGKKDGGYITGQDAAMRLFDVLCPLGVEGEGKFCPVSLEEGEDGNLIVNKCILKCLVHVSESEPKPESLKKKGKVLYKTDLTQEDWLEQDAHLTGDNVFTGFDYRYQIVVALLPDFAADGTPVKALGDNSLKDCNSLVSVDLPSSLQTIGYRALYNCINLKHLTLPDSVTSIEKEAVSHCNNLSSVYLPSSLKYIGDSAFREDTSLLSVFIPPCQLDEEIFYNCTSLSSAELGEGSANTGTRRLFTYCSSLVEVKLPNTLTSISDDTFARCISLSSIDIPSGLVNIGSQAFATCSSLTGLVLPASINSIGRNAFNYSYSVVLSGIQFKGKTMAQVEAIPEYRWALRPNRISAELG